ncbi:LytR cell envelope-related transcriptional attenuator [Rathayibacter tanaceti]|uniref:LytR family transcriptional regulator n=2 Tax=Rathayibacter tanaceti TaxID=1671680 RepID=A0AAE6V6S5_9MICO|nr:LytR C-terminal domain-containing protein [Rathayibacter tanaceti]QHC56163.1 LytR family transcriptional regulator [Rathayibacter tanaceti]TCO37007.1 LytR cell envelope-related transcriptional attenuator [Rathayibacter tanaceti]
MSNTHPRDRFDEIPATEGRIGAHRRPPAPHARAIAFAWAALATGVIVLLGFIGLLVIDNRVQFTDVFTAPTDAAGASSAPTAVATVDPSLGVAVLNGTATAGLAASAGDALTTAGWSVPTVANANTENVATTTVYYTDPALEGAALGLVGSLGTGSVALSQDFVETGAVVVVLGADYVAAQG